MWGLLQRNIFRRPFYRTVTAPFMVRRFAHDEEEPYTEGPNGFLFNEKVCFPPFMVRPSLAYAPGDWLRQTMFDPECSAAQSAYMLYNTFVSGCF